jgi:hypothetical protein
MSDPGLPAIGLIFNALNTLAALSRVSPGEVPRAVGRLRHFLRASFDQHEWVLAPLEQELTIVRSRARRLPEAEPLQCPISCGFGMWSGCLPQVHWTLIAGRGASSATFRMLR